MSRICFKIILGEGQYQAQKGNIDETRLAVSKLGEGTWGLLSYHSLHL